MADALKIALCQIHVAVGDVPGNAARIAAAAAEAHAAGADLALFPELTLAGYPPEDLLYHAGLRRQVESALERLTKESAGLALAIGHPEYVGDRIHNALTVLAGGRAIASYRKQLLPNYRVFDEKRYFTPGDLPAVVELGGIKLGLTICEDLWWPGPAEQSARAGAELLINPSASPYEIGKPAQRERVFAERVREAGAPVVTVNHVCGQDELVFEGASFALDAAGTVVARLPESREAVQLVEYRRVGTIDVSNYCHRNIPRSKRDDPDVGNDQVQTGWLLHRR